MKDKDKNLAKLLRSVRASIKDCYHDCPADKLLGCSHGNEGCIFEMAAARVERCAEVEEAFYYMDVLCEAAVNHAYAATEERDRYKRVAETRTRWAKMALKKYRRAQYEAAGYAYGAGFDRAMRERAEEQLKRAKREFARQSERLDAAIEDLRGNCDVCENSSACINYPCFCINGSAWEWRDIVEKEG